MVVLSATPFPSRDQWKTLAGLCRAYRVRPVRRISGAERWAEARGTGPAMPNDTSRPTRSVSQRAHGCDVAELHRGVDVGGRREFCSTRRIASRPSTMRAGSMRSPANRRDNRRPLRVLGQRDRQRDRTREASVPPWCTTFRDALHDVQGVEQGIDEPARNRRRLLANFPDRQRGVLVASSA